MNSISSASVASRRSSICAMSLPLFDYQDVLSGTLYKDMARTGGIYRSIIATFVHCFPPFIAFPPSQNCKWIQYGTFLKNGMDDSS
mmetsp:Transcript_6017/g.12403  ORF Transcript_6017/g.12403 Transcript_6017/m.12403 type:complete len:86 (+) Transcript_6017:416-673(+)